MDHLCQWVIDWCILFLPSVNLVVNIYAFIRFEAAYFYRFVFASQSLRNIFKCSRYYLKLWRQKLFFSLTQFSIVFSVSFVEDLYIWYYNHPTLFILLWRNNIFTLNPFLSNLTRNWKQEFFDLILEVSIMYMCVPVARPHRRERGGSKENWGDCFHPFSLSLNFL